MVIFGKIKKSLLLLSVSLTLTLGLAAIRPVLINAGVADESTYDSAVKGSNTTYYRTIATNYHAGNVLGLVSISSAQEMSAAANVTEENQKNGFEPVLYVNTFDWDSDERKAAEAVVEKMSGTLVTMVDIQLFRYELTSFVPVTKAGGKVTLIAGIPEKASDTSGNVFEVQKEGREYAMVRVHNGQVTVLKDLYSDIKTLTFQTDQFSAFGLMYAPEGEIDKYLGNPADSTAGADSTGFAVSTDADTGELDEVPKTGDIRWEIEYGYAPAK